jgi:hypothetical protein
MEGPQGWGDSGPTDHNLAAMHRAAAGQPHQDPRTAAVREVVLDELRSLYRKVQAEQAKGNYSPQNGYQALLEHLEGRLQRYQDVDWAYSGGGGL